MQRFLFFIVSLLCLVSCEQKSKTALTPWGTPIDSETGLPLEAADSASSSLTDIQSNGEMILLTTSGPDTYYDYRGRGMGTQYLLCEKLAQHLGVSLRVELCKDSAEMLQRLDAGEGDIAAGPLKVAADSSKTGSGTNAQQSIERLNWQLAESEGELADSIKSWFRPELIAQVQREADFALSSRSVTRRVYLPMLNRAKGTISHYDHLFMKYAPTARWDWRLLAALCYQESTFDPQAHSWAGACGLMQIMPATAAHLGLPISMIYEPEPNISASARYIAELSGKFSDVRNANERYNYVLASYNGGFFHIRDAMALARKYGKNPYRWADVSEFVLKLSSPQFYNDPVVKYGYMRGDETVNYVSSIRHRWAQYRGVAHAAPSSSGAAPQKATRKHRFKL